MKQKILRTLSYALMLVFAAWIVFSWPFLWEIGLLAIIGGAYLCFFHSWANRFGLRHE